jgi:hypothetical protein
MREHAKLLPGMPADCRTLSEHVVVSVEAYLSDGCAGYLAHPRRVACAPLVRLLAVGRGGAKKPAHRPSMGLPLIAPKLTISWPASFGRAAVDDDR